VAECDLLAVTSGTAVFGSEILDVAIGLALIYLLLSLIASAVREGIEGIIKARAIYLERGIRELLDDPSGDTLAKQFYEHPLVYALFPGKYTAGGESSSTGAAGTS
jgi:hypothetical protein